jgi:TatD DNase family protein
MAASTNPPLIDVDCNLWHRDLKSLQGNENGGNVWNILQEDAIESSNIVAMLSPSSTIREAEMGIQRLETTAPPLDIKTTVGVHPYHVKDEDLQQKSFKEYGIQIQNLLQSHPRWCAAVGECGLDTSEGFPPLEDQLPWFQLQAGIAQNLGIPLFVHERLAFKETMKILEHVTVPVIIHCFTGTKQECAEYIERGYSISVSGFIMKEDAESNAEDVRSCLREGIIPLNKLMIETDSPYMGFAGCRQRYLEHNDEFVSSLNSKKRKRLAQSIYPNVPSSLPDVLNKVVECLQQHDASLTREMIASQTTQNAMTFFSFNE